MSCESETAAVLRGARQKVTLQRMVVLSALRHAAGEHVTAARLLEDVRRSYPYIHASTVYRTLSAAKELRLVSETSIGRGDDRFEWLGEGRHHHLVCRSCGSIASLDSRYLEHLAIALAKGEGFVADLDHFVISGVCRACRRDDVQAASTRGP